MGTEAQWFVLMGIAYLAGSIPFGLVVGRLKGIDPRSAGSGNIGATNVGRLLGVRYFWLVFLLDLLKGLAPTLLAAWVLHRRPGAEDDWRIAALWLAVAAAAILGHMFSIFLKFKGGKGVATSAGVVLGVYPYYTLVGAICIAVFTAVFLVWRYISLASIAGAVTFPLIYLAIGWWRGWPIFGAQLPLLIAACLLAALIVFKHRGNIVRLWAGTENRLGSRRAAGPAESTGE